MPETGKTIISVIGGSSANADELHAAEEVGREIARRSAVLACGGLGGIMEAACRGAKAEGGTTVGIIPGVNRSAANEYVDIPIVTGMGYARNVIVAYTGDAVIAIGGKVGTLSEMAFAAIKGTPLVSLGSWELDAERLAPQQVHRAKTAKEAVDIAFKLVTREGGRR